MNNGPGGVAGGRLRIDYAVVNGQQQVCADLRDDLPVVTEHVVEGSRYARQGAGEFSDLADAVVDDHAAAWTDVAEACREVVAGLAELLQVAVLRYAETDAQAASAARSLTGPSGTSGTGR